MPTNNNKTIDKGSDARFILVVAGAIAIIIAAFTVDWKLQDKLRLNDAASSPTPKQEDCLEWEIYYVDAAGASVPVRRGIVTRDEAQRLRDQLDSDYRYRRRHSIRCAKWRGN